MRNSEAIQVYKTDNNLMLMLLWKILIFTFPSEVHVPAAALPKLLLEMQNLIPYSRPMDTEFTLQQHTQVTIIDIQAWEMLI